MFHVMLDTSVWLDLAENQKQTPLLDPLENLLSHGYISILIPQMVLDEFAKNRQRIADRAQRSLTSHFSAVKDAIRKVDGNEKQKSKVLTYLGDIDHRIPLVGGVATQTLDRIERIFKSVTPIELNDEVKLRAADRALHRHAPCHHDNKNSIADAVLIETYFECARKGKPRERFAFVTHNKHDFSDMQRNQKTPHPQLTSGFTKIRSLYFTTLAECFQRIDAGFVREVMFESNYEQEIRSLSDIVDAIDTLTTQVWYNRHKNREYLINKGKVKIVSKAEWDETFEKHSFKATQDLIVDEIWKGALKSAKNAERKLGEGNYGPWTDFEWGMLNGKLSALRWALGEEWDMLDT